MLPVRRFASLAFSIAVLASCSQLVGLDDLDPDDDEGDGGTGLSSGATGGDDEGGSDGNGGNGGKGGSSGGKGGSGGSSGSSAGDGGQPSDGGEGGDDSRGGSISDGGTKVTAGAGGGGTGGTTTVPEFDIPEDCSEIIEITSFAPHSGRLSEANGSATYGYVATPGFGASLEDIVSFQAYTGGSNNGEQTGTFEIEGSADSSYVTCSRCVLAYEDDDAPNFFAMGGTVTVASDSDHMEGQPNVTLNDITLVESTILTDPPYTSTPLENARCLHIQTAVLNNDLPPEPPVWSANCDGYWFDGYCDCGCGTHDIDCETNDLSECFADACYCDADEVCSTVDNGLCVPE